MDATAQGTHVVLATARPPRSVRDIYKHLRLNTPTIHYNGALVHHMPQKKHLFHKPIPAKLTKKIIKFARRVDPDVVVSVEILDKWYTDHHNRELLTATAHKYPPDFVGPFVAFMHQPVTKLMLLAPAEKMKRIAHSVLSKYGEQVTIAVSDKHLIQIIHPEVDKGSALASVAKSLGIARQRVMAVGDAPNDIGMIKWSGLGVAMENAWPRVLEVCDAVTESNDNDGLAKAIEKYVLRRGRSTK